MTKVERWVSQMTESADCCRQLNYGKEVSDVLRERNSTNYRTRKYKKESNSRSNGQSMDLRTNQYYLQFRNKGTYSGVTIECPVVPKGVEVLQPLLCDPSRLMFAWSTQPHGYMVVTLEYMPLLFSSTNDADWLSDPLVAHHVLKGAFFVLQLTFVYWLCLQKS
jgi:hypothetical protein